MSSPQPPLPLCCPHPLARLSPIGNGGPKKADLTFKGDPNPFMQSGHTSIAGRKFELLASVTPAQVKTIHIDEGGMDPRCEHMPGAIPFT